MARMASRWVSRDGRTGYLETDSALGSNASVVIYYGDESKNVGLSKISGNVYSFQIPVVDKKPVELAMDFEVHDSTGVVLKYLVENGKDTDTTFTPKKPDPVPELPENSVLVEYWNYFTGWGASASGVDRYQRAVSANIPLVDETSAFWSRVTLPVNRLFHDPFHPVSSTREDVEKTLSSPAGLFMGENLQTYVITEDEVEKVLVPISSHNDAALLEFNSDDFWSQIQVNEYLRNRYNSGIVPRIAPTPRTTTTPSELPQSSGFSVGASPSRYFQSEIPTAFRSAITIIESDFNTTLVQFRVIGFTSISEFEKPITGGVAAYS